MKVMRMTLCALFAALTAVCAQVAVPLGAVPANLALLPVLLGAALLPRRYALASAGLYLLLGVIGLPVFAGFGGGAGVLAGPTGGFLAGYGLCAWLAALLREKGIPLWLSMVCGVAGCYVTGVAWLMIAAHMTILQALVSGVLPFAAGDGVKIALVCMLARRLKMLKA